MIKKSLITLVVFVFLGVLVFAVGLLADSSVSLPKAIGEDSPFPAVGCASGTCHGYDDVPMPDGVHEMDCPKVSCSSVDCHAWDTLITKYNKPRDASLNLWILAPVILVVTLVLIVRRGGSSR